MPCSDYSCFEHRQRNAADSKIPANAGILLLIEPLTSGFNSGDLLQDLLSFVLLIVAALFDDLTQNAARTVRITHI